MNGRKRTGKEAATEQIKITTSQYKKLDALKSSSYEPFHVVIQKLLDSYERFKKSKE